MILSRRFIPHLVALAVLAMLPILLHNYLGHQRDECADPFRLVPSTNVDKPERDAHMKKHVSAFQWREGTLAGANREPSLDYTIIRSYDAKKLYYRLERRLLLDLEPDEEKRLDVSLDGIVLPIRTLRFDPTPGSRTGGLAAYLLVYDGEPVDNPYLNQLLAAPANIVLGALPMTAFFVESRLEAEQSEDVRARQIEWLEQSWRSYRSICFP